MSPPPAKKVKTNGNNYNRKKIFVQTGQRGFLATCNYQEKGCIRECFNILAHYANFVYGADCEVPQPDEINDIEDLDTDDITDELQRGINDAQQQCYKPKKARFLALDTGALNTVFIRTTLQDPVQLGYFIVRDLWNTKSQRTRSLIRLIPIEIVCTVNIQAIVNAVGPVFDKYFVNEPCTYSIVVNRRLNNSIDRDVIIRELAALVRTKNSKNTVDLRNPSKTIVVEIIKGTCMIGVLPSYFKYKKYNLIECARQENAMAPDFDMYTQGIMQPLPLSLEETEESPESPVDGDEDIEEPMEGPIEEPAGSDATEATATDEAPEKSLTDSPDSPQDEPKVAATTATTKSPEPAAAAAETKEEGKSSDEPKTIENSAGNDGEDSKVEKTDAAEEGKISVEIADAVKINEKDKNAEENNPDINNDNAGEKINADDEKVE